MIDTGVQVIILFYLSNLKGCNVGITDGLMMYATVMGSGAMIYIVL
jgi:hypothetical protein